MSRVAKSPVEIPSGVSITLKGQELSIKGGVGKLDLNIHEDPKNIVKPLEQAGREFDDAVLQPVKEGVQAVTEPVVDVVAAFIDAIDSPLGDLLGAGGDLLGGMLGGSQGQQQQRTASTPTEGLFDKELFKFDTEIKSTQEMLSPMMNLRKYG